MKIKSEAFLGSGVAATVHYHSAGLVTLMTREPFRKEWLQQVGLYRGETSRGGVLMPLMRPVDMKYINRSFLVRELWECTGYCRYQTVEITHYTVWDLKQIASHNRFADDLVKFLSNIDYFNQPYVAKLDLHEDNFLLTKSGKLMLTDPIYWDIYPQ